MEISYWIHRNGPFYEVWDNTADWVDTFDTETDALTCIAHLQAEDQRIRTGLGDAQKPG